MSALRAQGPTDGREYHATTFQTECGADGGAVGDGVGRGRDAGIGGRLLPSGCDIRHALLRLRNDRAVSGDVIGHRRHLLPRSVPAPGRREQRLRLRAAWRQTRNEARCKALNQPEVDMTNFIKAAGLAGILVAALATATPELKADQLNNAVREGHAVTTELGGNASAVTYWVSKS